MVLRFIKIVSSYYCVDKNTKFIHNSVGVNNGVEGFMHQLRQEAHTTWLFFLLLFTKSRTTEEESNGKRKS